MPKNICTFCLSQNHGIQSCLQAEELIQKKIKSHLSNPDYKDIFSITTVPICSRSDRPFCLSDDSTLLQIIFGNVILEIPLISEKKVLYTLNKLFSLVEDLEAQRSLPIELWTDRAFNQFISLIDFIMKYLQGVDGINLQSLLI